ncbi:MAG: hypothetical protein JXR91_05915 [Deltaproteobacteria bacterium]|nr:hypothetical protein [Deltaproteobacteria bacterium]
MNVMFRIMAAIVFVLIFTAGSCASQKQQKTVHDIAVVPADNMLSGSSQADTQAVEVDTSTVGDTAVETSPGTCIIESEVSPLNDTVLNVPSGAWTLATIKKQFETPTVIKLSAEGAARVQMLIGGVLLKNIVSDSILIQSKVPAFYQNGVYAHKGRFAGLSKEGVVFEVTPENILANGRPFRFQVSTSCSSLTLDNKISIDDMAKEIKLKHNKELLTHYAVMRSNDEPMLIYPAYPKEKTETALQYTGKEIYLLTVSRVREEYYGRSTLKLDMTREEYEDFFGDTYFPVLIEEPGYFMFGFAHNKLFKRSYIIGSEPNEIPPGTGWSGGRDPSVCDSDIPLYAIFEDQAEQIGIVTRETKLNLLEPMTGGNENFVKVYHGRLEAYLQLEKGVQLAVPKESIASCRIVM